LYLEPLQKNIAEKIIAESTAILSNPNLLSLVLKF